MPRHANWLAKYRRGSQVLDVIVLLDISLGLLSCSAVDHVLVAPDLVSPL